MRKPRNAVLIRRAHALRTNLTKPESRLWLAMSNRKLKGAKFSRQIVVGGYIGDFVCREHRLIVELDGSQHFESQYGEVPDARLRALGYRVLRFQNCEVMASDFGLEGVLARIAEYLPDSTC